MFSSHFTAVKTEAQQSSAVSVRVGTCTQTVLTQALEVDGLLGHLPLPSAKPSAEEIFIVADDLASQSLGLGKTCSQQPGECVAWLIF